MVYASSTATYGNLPSPPNFSEESPENHYGYISNTMLTNISLNIKHRILVCSIIERGL